MWPEGTLLMSFFLQKIYLYTHMGLNFRISVLSPEISSLLLSTFPPPIRLYLVVLFELLYRVYGTTEWKVTLRFFNRRIYTKVSNTGWGTCRKLLPSWCRSLCRSINQFFFLNVPEQRIIQIYHLRINPVSVSRTCTKRVWEGPLI